MRVVVRTGWAIFGLVATTGLTAAMTAAQLAGRSLLDPRLMLGTNTAEDPDRARVAGFAIHLAIGQIFVLVYAAGIAALDRSAWWLGAHFGVAHAAVALTLLVPLLKGAHSHMATEQPDPPRPPRSKPPARSPSTTARPPRWSQWAPTSSTSLCSERSWGVTDGASRTRTSTVTDRRVPPEHDITGPG
jgi:hypothetical protein